MIIAIILLAVGLGLIYSEFYLPGGIMGALGGILCIASIVWCIKTSDSFIATAIFVVGAVLLFIFSIKFALWNIRHSNKKDGIYNIDDQEGYHASEYQKDLLGKSGEASSDLHPSGFVVIEGKRVQAVSQSGYIKKGALITVISGRGAHLIVKQMKEGKEK